MHRIFHSPYKINNYPVPQPRTTLKTFCRLVEMTEARASGPLGQCLCWYVLALPVDTLCTVAPLVIQDHPGPQTQNDNKTETFQSSGDAESSWVLWLLARKENVSRDDTCRESACRLKTGANGKYSPPAFAKKVKAATLNARPSSVGSLFWCQTWKMTWAPISWIRACYGSTRTEGVKAPPAIKKTAKYPRGMLDTGAAIKTTHPMKTSTSALIKWPERSRKRSDE
jgi:hypothetical protein